MNSRKLVLFKLISDFGPKLYMHLVTCLILEFLISLKKLLATSAAVADLNYILSEIPEGLPGYIQYLVSLQVFLKYLIKLRRSSATGSFVIQGWGSNLNFFNCKSWYEQLRNN